MKELFYVLMSMVTDVRWKVRVIETMCECTQMHLGEHCVRGGCVPPDEAPSPPAGQSSSSRPRRDTLSAPRRCSGRGHEDQTRRAHSGWRGDDLRFFIFFFSSRRRHTRYWRDWSSDVCSSDLTYPPSHAMPKWLFDKYRFQRQVQCLDCDFFVGRRIGTDADHVCWAYPKHFPVICKKLDRKSVV